VTQQRLSENTQHCFIAFCNHIFYNCNKEQQLKYFKNCAFNPKYISSLDSGFFCTEVHPCFSRCSYIHEFFSNKVTWFSILGHGWPHTAFCCPLVRGVASAFRKLVQALKCVNARRPCSHLS